LQTFSGAAQQLDIAQNHYHRSLDEVQCFICGNIYSTHYGLCDWCHCLAPSYIDTHQAAAGTNVQHFFIADLEPAAEYDCFDEVVCGDCHVSRGWYSNLINFSLSAKLLYLEKSLEHYAYFFLSKH